jgi:hypothetical protein
LELEEGPGAVAVDLGDDDGVAGQSSGDDFFARPFAVYRIRS